MIDNRGTIVYPGGMAGDVPHRQLTAAVSKLAATR